MEGIVAKRREVIKEEITGLRQEQINLAVAELSHRRIASIVEKTELLKKCEIILEDYFKLSLEGKPYSALKKIYELPTDSVFTHFLSYLGLCRSVEWATYWTGLHAIRKMYGSLRVRKPPIDIDLYKSGQLLA